MTKKTQIPPEGLHYQRDVLPAEEEQELVERIQTLPLKEFEFHGYTGKRRVLSFGWHYDFSDSKLKQTEEIPNFYISSASAPPRSRTYQPKSYLMYW